MGHEVLVLDDLSGGFRENVNPAATLVEGSVTDAGLVDSLFAVHKNPAFFRFPKAGLPM
ncbi:MAG: hypothetical protein ACLPND_10355 [Candidatus Korobacteraceae bacterium]